MKLAITIDLEQLAMWLAWSDRASQTFANPDRFAADARRYWEEHATEQLRGCWLMLAARLSGTPRASAAERQRARTAEIAAERREGPA